MLQDGLTTCRVCGSPACYQTFQQNLVSWKCVSCGYTSNSYMMKNTDVVKAFEETLPALYKDIKVLDEEGFTWYPLTYDAPGVGFLFADGTSKENWGWTVVPYVPVQFEEREKFRKKDGTYAKYKTDMSKGKTFGQMEFANALDYLGEL